MSDYRIGLVVEGTTDRIIIESALNKILANHTYILTQLQPESRDGLNNGSFGYTGGGWGGVYHLKPQHSHPFLMCIPSKCTEAWVAIALYGQTDQNILIDTECNSKIENYLAQKPARDRLIRNRSGKMKKITQKYSEKSEQITSQWDYTTQNCNQADIFTNRVYEKTNN
jgi:galactokinase